MKSRSWLRNLFTTRNRHPIRKAPRRARLALEALEDRWLPSTFTVNSIGDTGAGSGLSGDLRYCITQANLGGTNTIQFDPTVFATPQTILLTNGQLELSDTTGTETITGPAAGVTVSGNNASRVFQMDGGVTASIGGLTITGGSSFQGSGLSCNGGTTTLTNCTISGNSAFLGAGLNCTGGTTTLTNCTISGNPASFAGGGIFTSSGNLSLINSTISGNSAFFGGGLNCNEGTTTLTNCTVSGNSASFGGGSFAYMGNVSLTNCTVASNTARNGGGIEAEANVAVTCSTFSLNSATFGGAIDNPFGLYQVTIGDSILAGDSASFGPEVTFAVTSDGNNLVGETDNSSGWISSDLTGTSAQPLNPMLAPLGNYGGPTQTMALLPGSPAIGAGNINLVPAGITTDQRGEPRFVNGTVDIGAFESQGFTLTVVPGSSPQTSNIGTPFANPLAVSVTANNAIEPVDGGVVTFGVQPANGASALLSSSSAVVAGGQAAVSAAPNNMDGSYTVVASALGASPATFDLTNTGLVFTPLIVNTTSTSLFPGTGLLSLPEAIVFADLDTSGNSNITFDPTAFATPQTITLTGMQLELSNTTETETITGSAAGVTVSGGGLSRVFQIDTGVTASISGLTITDGSATNGGGLDNQGGTTTLTACTLSGNSAPAGFGGAIFSYRGALSLINCTVASNTAGISGGGIEAQGNVAVTSSTLSLNSATFGGAIDNFFGLFQVRIGDSILAGDSASYGPEVSNGVISDGNNLVSETDNSSGWISSDLTGTRAQPVNPMLAPLGNYGGPTQTMALLPGSPAIDAGSNALIAGVTTDQRGTGFPRIVNGTVDIGAFESSGFTIAVTSGSGQSTDIATAFAAPLVVTVTANNPSEPVAGGLITFTPPSSGASATISGSPATISASGTASVAATANSFAGSYTVSATAGGITTPASFTLSNRPTITVPAAQTAYENVDQPVNGILIGDAPSATVTVTLSVSHGTLTLGTTTGLTTVTGNGSGTVTLIGTTADLNAALATLVYRGSHNYSGGDTLSVTATDSGVSATPASVALTVESIAQQAANLQAQVSALQAAGVLNQGQANSLIVKLNLKGNKGDIGKVQAFLAEVAADLNAGMLTQAQADALLGPGNILLLSVTRR